MHDGFRVAGQKNPSKPDGRLSYLGVHNGTKNVGGTHEETIKAALSINSKAYPISVDVFTAFTFPELSIDSTNSSNSRFK